MGERKDRLLASDAYLSLDGRPRVVVLQPEVLVTELEYVLHLGIEHHSRQGTRSACQLQPDLLQMVEVDVGVARSVYELPWPESAHLRHHHAEKGVRGYVEGNSKEAVGTTLIQL